MACSCLNDISIWKWSFGRVEDTYSNDNNELDDVPWRWKQRNKNALQWQDVDGERGNVVQITNGGFVTAEFVSDGKTGN